MAAARLVEFDEHRWRNWHRSIELTIRARYEIHNADTPPSAAGMRATARELQMLIRRASEAGVRLRASGGRWSFSEVAAAPDGWMLDTAPINWPLRVAPSQVSPAYAGDPEGLLLIQAGLSIAELNKLLEQDLGRSIQASGASNGQTFVGAMSTGTHGSALDVGAIQGQVVGLQLLAGADRNLWLERASRPVADDGLAERLGATPIRDDRLFEAALVGLGGLGIVHSVMIETAPRFLLDVSQVTRPYDDRLKAAMDSLRFEDLDLPGGGEHPHFVQVVVNPYDHAAAYIKVMYKRPCPADYRPDYAIDGRYGAGYDVPGLLGKLVDLGPGITPALVGPMMAGQLKVFAHKLGTWGETFNYTTPRSNTVGAALAVPASMTTRAVTLVQEAFDEDGPAPLICACRYVAASPGALAFTRYDRTCVIDLDGIQSQRSRAVMEGVRRRLDASPIPYAQHWGKLHGLTASRVTASYGGAVDRWNAARRDLLPDTGAREVFSSAFLEGLGLG